MKTIYFITHPEVVIDPAVPVPDWPLSEKGINRMKKLLTQPWVQDVRAIYCSTEQKAIDGAKILADYLTLSYEMRQDLGENDRSSTGFLPKEEFETTANQFFAQPNRSIRGWETATAAQQRIIEGMNAIIDTNKAEGNIAVVSHGGVGALYLCYLKRSPISRVEDQPGNGGGNYYAFQPETKTLLHGWKPIDG
jgi:broad specificity phosphatase PhoE